MDDTLTMETRYQPAGIEDRWYQFWDETGVFRPEMDPDKDAYCIVIPPPNVTGALHMGHALNNMIQDVYVRQARMLGKCTLWLPGTDHAGIATQNVVEKALMKEGLRKEDLGRDAFVARVWEWKGEYETRITNQLKKMGFSCDWSRQRFTLDDGLSKAVREVFVRLYEEGLIYRGEALVNWCPRCLTTLSNEECPAVEDDGHFYDLLYPVVGEDGRSVTVSTTRPETMLGDTAVAVHPDDERYRDLIGRTLMLPLMGREIPVVADPHADPEKGSGAVKITPAHDFDDFQVSCRHDLPRVVVIGPDGTMTEEAGAYAGLDRFEARKKVLADLKESGQLGTIEDRKIPLPRCYRCDTVVEPHLSTQWFVKMRPLLEPAAEAVKDGRVEIRPARYAKLYLEWVEKYIDWPISRQLWWGHRIPVYYCQICEETMVAREAPEICTACGSADVVQDEDVLDTWFSSQLWPLSTLGWPDETEDLEKFYKTDLLVTDRGIIYFWVARMVMAGLKFRDEVPFDTVYIHGTILDETGRRMSKSLGNGIDPVEMVGVYGADAVRFSLLMLASEGQDIKLSESRFEMGRNFVNKLWNASRFAIMNMDQSIRDVSDDDLEWEDRWILSRLNQTVRQVTEGLADYKLNETASAIYTHVWREFCDWYLEIVKPRLYTEETTGAAARSRSAALWTLAKSLRVTLRLLHPLVPFVTEEIHDHLTKKIGNEPHTISFGAWPEPDEDRIDPAIDAQMDLMTRITRAIRNMRAEMHVPEGKKVDVLVSVKEEDVRAAVEEHAGRISLMAKLSGLTVGIDLEKPAAAATAVDEDLEIYLPLGDVIDLEAEKERLKKEQGKVEGQMTGASKKLSNRSFLEKAPEEVVQRERDKCAALATRLEAIKKHLAALSGE